jgi:hypothetical protein
MYRTENTVSYNTPSVACVPISCLETGSSIVVCSVHFRGNLFTEPLPSDERFRLPGIMSHCSRLKAIRPKWPTGAPPFFLFWGLCLLRLWSVSPSFPWLVFFRGVYSPTAPTALSGSLIIWKSVQVYHHHPVFPIGGGKLPKVDGAPTFLASTLCAVSISSLEGSTPPQCPVTRSSQPTGNPDSSLHDLQP